MRTTFATLALAAAATALPSQNRCRDTTSKGFTLTAHVTNPDIDITPSAEGLVVSSAHTGAGLAAAVLTDGTPRLFYQNGSTASHESTLLTDSGTPPFPVSVQIQKQTDARRIIDISVGQGSPAYIDEKGLAVNAFGPGTFLACHEVIPYYNQTFVTLQYIYGEVPTSGEDLGDCAVIELQAKCAELNELPDGSLASHEFAQDVACQA